MLTVHFSYKTCPDYLSSPITFSGIHCLSFVKYTQFTEHLSVCMWIKLLKVNILSTLAGRLVCNISYNPRSITVSWQYHNPQCKALEQA